MQAVALEAAHGHETTCMTPYDAWFGADAFDATYGYDDAGLRDIGVPEEPPGLVEFWRALYAAALEVDVAPDLSPATGGAAAGTSPLDRPSTEVYDVSFTSLGGVQINGWVALPADGVVERAVVVSHGYGGRDEPDLTMVPERSAAIFPVARGLPTRSLLPGVPAEGSGHVLHGIESRETYIHGGCAADVWCAATALLRLLPDYPSTLAYVGGSFGGGIGALALPWDHRFTSAVLYVPSFGHHPLRLTMPCTGSGEAVRLYAEQHPEVRDVLAYFDAAVAAQHLRIPTLLGPALWDPAVPPPGQFAICNAIPAEKELFTFSAGHAEYPGDADELARFTDRARAHLASRVVDDDAELTQDGGRLV